MNNSKPQTNQKGSIKNILRETATGLVPFFVIALISTILAIIFNYLTPQVIRITVDSIIGNEPLKVPEFIENFINTIGGRDVLRNNLIICAGATIIFSVLSGLFNFICHASMAKTSEGMIRRIRDKLYLHTQRLPYKWHIKNQTGDIIQRCTSDVDVIRNFLSNQLLEVFRTIFLLILSLSLMFSMNVKLSLIALIFIPIVIAYSGIFYKMIGDRFKVADEAEGALSATVQENFTGVRVVRAFGKESHEINRFKEKNNYFANLWIKLGYLLGSYWGVGDLVSGLQVMTIVIVGVLEAVNGNLTQGEFLAFVSYNSMLVWPIRSFGRILAEMSKTGVSLSRLADIFDAKEEKDVVDCKPHDMTGDIEFENVKFTYLESELNPVLNNVNFKIKSGSTFGILGKTGSGKSTLMYLLDRLYDLPNQNGKITIGGVDIRNIPLSYLRKNIGFVLQEPFLFSKTIRENIGVTSDSINIDSVRNFASVAAVDDAIMAFDEKYDTVVGERGVTLSGGQKQRVAIARMLMQDTPIKIFDDSMSAVDTETDEKIRNSLKSATDNSTVILISHRITTLMKCDHIIVVDDGKIVESGTHTELIKVNGIYRKIYDIQGSLEDELSESI